MEPVHGLVTDSGCYRHGHLMLFDDDEQLEVRHVISLAHHDVSIYSGGDVTPEGELFIKRNALCLSRRTDGVDLPPDSQLSKPFYLFSENCSAKEDFYFAMIRNQEQSFPADGRVPAPLQFDVKHMISLVQKLHSSEEHLQSRWLNAMIGRIFLGIYKTPDLENFIREKLTKKISRVKRPAFLSSIEIRKIDTGEAAPYFTNLRHRDLTVEGECCIEADVKYTGNFRIEVAAVARIELGTRLKAREVNLVLSVAMRKLEGHMLFKVKAPPSDRIWFSFSQMPKIEMTIEPIVSARQITYTVILRQIESRIKEVIAETLVLPFWDDSPFFNTSHKKWRGGIFAGDDAVDYSSDPETQGAELGDVDDVDELEAGATSPTSVDLLSREKSHSMPVLEHLPPPTGLFGRKLANRKTFSTGLQSPNADASASSTSLDTKSVDSKIEAPVKHNMPERSSSFVNEPTPTVGTDTVNAEFFKPSSPPGGESPAASAMAKLSAKSQTWSHLDTPSAQSLHTDTLASTTPVDSSASSKTNTDKEGDNDDTLRSIPRRGTGSSTASIKSEGKAGSSSPVPSTKASLKSHAGSLNRGFFLKRESSNASLATTSTKKSGTDSPPKRNTLAAVSNVAGAAKRWGWNALQRNADAKNGPHPQSESQVDLSKPMGGGRPLPPPGMPLPMPEKKTKTAPAVPRRKPVAAPPLPERPSASATRESDHKRRPVPPPPLPRRRQRAESATQEDEENMLVVEAPLAESEPTSPNPEERGRYMQPWAEDAEDGDDDHSPVDSHTPDMPSHLTGETSRAHLSEEPIHSSGSSLKEQSAAEDDEYSAWMDNPGDSEPVPNVITSEGIAQ